MIPTDMGKPRIMFRICFGAGFGALRAFPAPTTWTDAGLPSLRGAVEQSETERFYAAFADLPPPPDGWEVLVGSETVSSLAHG